MTDRKVLSIEEAACEAINSNIKIGPPRTDSWGGMSSNLYTGDGKVLWIAFPSGAAPISPSRFYANDELEPDATRTNIFRDTDSSFDFGNDVREPRTMSSVLNLPSRKKQRRDKRYKGRG
jgi:hypothetical protein